ncbi:MAG: hypothetical protein KC912_04260 [Proteobacteria bacterium]|nr:hypothetical protein [Pseudomonadota bacterium]
MLLLLIATAHALDWSVALGAQVDADSHGIATVIASDGPWSVGLHTDTLDFRVAPELDRGRAWAALRLQAGAAGLLISPWSDGAPDPERALTAGIIGAEGGVVRYLNHGLWWGGQVRSQAWWFLPQQDTTIEVPGWSTVGRADGMAGWWTEAASIDLIAGVDAQPHSLSPHVSTRARWTPGWVVRPHVEVQAGWADRQDMLTLTRLGGMNPYVVPLAGAAWAEFWVEDYVAAQAGPELNLETLRFGLFAEVAHFQGRTELGLSPRVHWQPGALWFDLRLGYAPTLERVEGIAASGYLLVGWSPK